MHEFPKAERVKKRRFSPVWLTPMLALAITAWLIFSGYLNSGIEIRVQFDSGAGIVVGKTPLQYRGLNVGKVTGFEVSESLDKVNVVIKLDKRATGIAKEGMMFWVVKPRLSIDRITGLETIISGAYIEVRPPTYDLKTIQKLKEQTFFIGYADPPGFQFSDGSVILKLVTDADINLFKGMSIYHKGVEAGKVMDVLYDDNTKKHRITVGISRKFGKYINDSSRFWSSSGVDVKLDQSGFEFHTPPLTAIFQGGISFESDYESEEAAPEKEYVLYNDREQTLLGTVTAVIHMPESFGISKNRTPVMYKGIRVGLVTGVDLSLDKKGVDAYVNLIKCYEDMLRKGTRFVMRKPEISISGVKNLSSAISGVYFEVSPGDGDASDEFTLYNRPLAEVPAGSENITLTAGSRNGIDVNSGLYFSGVQVGTVTGYRLEKGKVVFDAAVYPEHKALLNGGLYAWVPAALSIGLKNGGLNVKTSGLGQIMDGGVSLGYFGEPDKKPEHAFTLYTSEADAKEAFISAQGIKKLYLTSDDSSGLENGAPITYKGIKAGELGNRYLNGDGTVRITAMIYSQYRNLVNGHTYFWKPGGATMKFVGQELNVHIPAVHELVIGGVAFDNDAPDTFKETGKLFGSRQAAEKAVADADAAAGIRLYTEAGDFPYTGAGVYYRGAKAGEVTDAGYDKATGRSYADVIIYRSFAGTVTDTTRFWISGKADVTATGEGFTLNTGPLASYITGALSYDSFNKAEGADKLYTDKDSAAEPDYAKADVILPEAYGFRPKAPVMMHGIRAGYVKEVMDEDGKITAKVYIYDKYADGLRKGALFWAEDANISLEGVNNPDSAVFGPKLMMLPGTGDKAEVFTASEEKASPYAGMNGLRLVLTSDTSSSLEVGSPVYYRQVPTGGVEWIHIRKDGSGVEIGVFISDRYRDLVRSGTKFISVSGIDAGFGFFSGFRLRTQTIKSVITGGVSFETPDMTDPAAKDGDEFEMK